MLRFFLNRELATRFQTNLAKWKRWSREFLPPDPLGGMQSGFARQYSVKDAFIVFLGGHLVGDLKYPIPEAKRILTDLSDWLSAKGFYGTHEISNTKGAESAENQVKWFLLFVTKTPASNGAFHFVYRIRGIIAEDTATYRQQPVKSTLYTENWLGDHANLDRRTIYKNTKIIYITDVYNDFVNLINHG